MPPGAERFWGQFSQARSGRSRAGEDAAHGDRPGHGEHQCLDWCPICRTAELMRTTATPELRAQLQHLQEEALSVLRAVAASYAEKADERRRQEEAPATPDAEEPKGGSPVKDISIE